MALDAVANFVRGETDASVDNTQTTISVVDATIFPDPSTEGEYNVVIWAADSFPRPDQDPDVEVVRVTATDGTADELTVTRGQEGTSAAGHPSGSAVQLSPTAKMFSDIENELANSGLQDGEDFDGQGTSDFTNLQSVDTDELSGSYPSLVYGIADTGVVESVDPSTASTPVQDAIDAVSTAGGGSVVLPAGTIQEGASLNPRSFVTVRGRGMQQGTAIQFPSGTDGIVFDQTCLFFEMESVSIKGQGPTAAAADGFVHTGTADVRGCRFDHVRFAQWHGHAMNVNPDDANGNHYENNYPYVLCDFTNAADETEPAVVRFGPPTTSNYFGILAVYPDDGDGTQASDAFHADGLYTEVEHLNCGGALDRAVNNRTTTDKQMNMLRIGHVNYEPASQPAGSPRGAVETNYQQRLWLGGLTISAGSVDYGVKLGTNNGNCIIGRIEGSAGAFNLGRLTVDAAPSSESWYFGPSSEINNFAGSSTGLVRSLATAGTGNA